MITTTSQINEIIDTVISQHIQSKQTDLTNLKLSILHKLPNAFKESGNLQEVERVLKIMQQKDLIVIPAKDYYEFTETARQIFEEGGWLKTLKSDNAEIELEREIKRLSKDQLELSIREMRVNFTQIRYWWLVLIITTIASALLGAWLQSLFK